MTRTDWVAVLGGWRQYTASIGRVGLGLVILLAGIHKLIDPAAWAVYVGPYMETILPMSPVTFMLINGVLEPPFAIALIADRYTVFAAAFVALSLAATTVYIGVLGLLTGQFLDVLIRDLGLTVLAVTVTLQATGKHTSATATD